MKAWRYLLLVGLLIFPVVTVAYNIPKKVTIVLTTPSEDALGAIQLLVHKFNSEQSGIIVKHKILFSGSDDCHDFYLTSFMEHSDSFDVFSSDIIWTPEFALNGWIEPIDSFFKKTEQAKFLAGTIKSCIYNQKIWAVPWYTDFGVLFYRKDIIRDPPTTWSELITLAKENIKTGKVKYGYSFQGNQYEGLICNALEFIFSNGGEVLDGNKVVINSPEAVKGLQLLIDIIKICPEEVIYFQEEDSRLAFQNGQILFLRNWPYDWNLLNREGSPIKGKVGIAPLPVGSNGSKGGGTLGGWNLMINHFSKKKLAAWKFIEFMTSVEGQKINSIIGGRLPTRTIVYQEPDVLKVNPHYVSFFTVYSRSKPRPVSPFYPALSETMQTNFYKAITGKIDAKIALVNIEVDMRRILAQ